MSTPEPVPDLPAGADLFGPGPEAESIQAGQNRNWLTSFGSRGAVQLSQLVTAMLLARWLSPSEFGVVAMVMSVIGIGNVLRDMGLSTATVRHPEVTPEQVSVLYWINVGLGLGLTLLACLAAPALARMYGDPRVTGVALLLSSTFLLGALAAQHLALLRRNLRIGDLARIDVLGAAVTSVVALALALRGAGYWAMAISSVVGLATTTVLAWVLCDWRPTLPRRGTGVEPMLRFGSHLVTFGLLSFVALNVHSIVLGLAQGATTVGVYNRALQLVVLAAGTITAPLTAVATSALSRLATNPAEYRRYYLRCAGAVTLLAAPVSVVLLVDAGPVMQLLFGSQWADSVLPLRILAISLVPQVLFPTAGWLQLSRGNSLGMMRWGLVGWTCHIVLTLIGLQFGLVGIAAACIAGHFLLLLPTLNNAMAGTEISSKDVWSVSWGPLLAAALATPMLLLPHAGWPMLALSIAAFLAAYALGLLLPSRERALVLGLAGAVRQRLAGRAAS